MKRTVDTNILMSLEDLKELVEVCEGTITVPIYVLEELDNLKGQEGDRGYKARRALRNLEAYRNNIEFYIPDEIPWGLPEGWDRNKVDNKLVNLALFFKVCGEESILYSNDLNVRIKCESLDVATSTFFRQPKIDTGWVEVSMNKREFADFEEGQRNKYGVPEGQYLIVRDGDGHELLGIYKYLGEKDWMRVEPERLGNGKMGTISPKDAYQQCAINSLLEDNFTIITGKAGTGKTLLSLTYALREIQNRREKLIIFANPAKTRGSAELGFYKGDRTEKLLQNSIGSMLSSKLGDMYGVEMLLAEGKVEILPVSDIRGFEVSKNQIMYITEAQNLSVDLMKLAIQRCAEGAKVILEGDPLTQVDHYSFEGSNNGLSRAIEVFTGYLGFSHVQLPNIYRSKIADRAEKM